MKVYANFGETSIQQAIAEGFDGLRVEGEPQALVSAFVDQPLRPLFLLHDVSHAEPLLDALLPMEGRLLEPAIEVFNELEEGRVDEVTYVDGVTQVYEDARARRFHGRIIAGGLMNLSRDSLDFYARVMPELPPDVVIGFHDYPYGNQQGPRRPWPRSGGIDELKQIANGRDIVCTEFGWHTWWEEAGFWIWKRDVRLTDEEVYQKLVTDFRRYAARGDLDVVVAFQWRDGPAGSTDFRDYFGLHAADGAPKRQLDAIRDWRL
jgi:hypothetical protein